RHLERCVRCRGHLAEQSDDDFLAKLREARHGSHTPAPEMSLEEVPATRDSVAQAQSLLRIGDLPPALAAHPEYTICRELGRGGMGVVYEAVNVGMDRREVLKVVHKDKLDKPGMLDRFRREVRAAGQLGHPNVVTAYRILDLGDVLALAMEYVE